MEDEGWLWGNLVLIGLVPATGLQAWPTLPQCPIRPDLRISDPPIFGWWGRAHKRSQLPFQGVHLRDRLVDYPYLSIYFFVKTKTLLAGHARRRIQIKMHGHHI